MAFDLGDTVPLAVTITDEDGAPVVAGSVTLSITRRADGQTLPATPGNPSVGRYVFDFVPDQVGLYDVRWTSTSPATAWDDVIDVRPAGGGVISLVDAKAHLNKALGGTFDDDELRPILAAAVERVAKHLGRPVGSAPTALELLAVKMVLTDFWRTQRARTRTGGISAGAPAMEADSGVTGSAPLRVRLTDLLGPAAEAGDEVPAPVGSFPPACGWPDPARPIGPGWVAVW